MKSVKTLSALALFAGAGMLLSQKPGIQRTFINQQDLSIPGREVRVARVEIAPGLFAGRHTHFGEEISYVIEGEIEVLVESKAPLKVKAGESFVIPNGARHDAHNAGTSPVKLVGVYVVEKDKPFATPAP
jgi:quercetin dioxygenase-like cupin family protein